MVKVHVVLDRGLNYVNVSIFGRELMCSNTPMSAGFSIMCEKFNTFSLVEVRGSIPKR